MTASPPRKLLILASLALALGGTAYPQSLILFPGPPPGPPVPLQDAIVGQNYFSGVSTNLNGPTTWSISAGSLPPGIGLISGSNFANFTGTPTATGSFVFTVLAIDQTGLKGSQQYSIQVVAPLTITTVLLRPATEGATYTGFLSAGGGVPPYSWALGIVSRLTSNGSRLLRRTAFTAPRSAAPTGLTLSSSGILSGTPTAAGSFSFDVTVFDSSTSNPQSVSGTVTLVVNLPPSVVTSSTLPGGVVGVRYSTPLRAQGGTVPYQWSVTAGSLPPGLTLASDGSLTGTPTQAGNYSFTGTVADLYGAKASTPFTLTVAAGLILTTLPPIPTGEVGIPYKFQFNGTSSSPPITWAATGLPNGLVMNPATGVVSGTPTAAGTFQFTLQATDAAKNTGGAGFTMTINAALAIVTKSLPDGSVGNNYSNQVVVSGGVLPFQFSVSGALPAGLSIDPSTGNVVGSPTTVGTSSFTVKVVDAVGATAQQSFTVKIIPNPEMLIFITPAQLPDATAGVPYTQQFTVTGGLPPFTFAITDGQLPAGLTMDATGKLSGTPTEVTVPPIPFFGFTVTVKDSGQGSTVGQQMVVRAFTLVVAAPALPPPTVTGVGDTAPPGQQPTLSVALGTPYPLPLDGTMDLTFASGVGSVDDPAIQFSTGGRTVKFTVPAGATTAVFPSAQISLATGTVAGTITLTMHFKADGEDVTPTPAPTRVIQIPAAAPVISNVAAHKTGTGIEVDVTGFSNTRDMVSAGFQFQAASGATLQGASATITADQLFGTWFSDAASNAFGSQFLYTQPFSLSGNVNGVASVTVTLTNKQGASSSASGTVQ